MKGKAAKNCKIAVCMNRLPFTIAQPHHGYGEGSPFSWYGAKVGSKDPAFQKSEAVHFGWSW